MIPIGTLADGRGRRERHRGGDPERPTADAATTTPYRMRLLAGWADTGTTADLAEHHRRYVPLPLAAFAGRGGSARLIGLVERSGLRGRGGGGFPTARKLAAVAAGRGPRTVVANGCEGDPAGAKDRVLMELAPHLVIDGILLAAHAVGATDAVLCVHEDSSAIPVLAAALRERGATRTAIRIVEVPRRYVASEETALVGFLDGGGARPRGRIPRPTERGVRGRPTLVDNVETLAHLALIARHGDAWFRAAGTDDSPGTTLVTVGGAVNDPGGVRDRARHPDRHDPAGGRRSVRPRTGRPARWPRRHLARSGGRDDAPLARAAAAPQARPSASPR